MREPSGGLDHEARIAELARGLELARQQMGRIRSVLTALLRAYDLAPELKAVPESRLAEMGLTAEEIVELRDVLLPVRNFGWLGDFRVAGCARPHDRAAVEALVAEGIGKLVTLTESPLPEALLQGLDLQVAHVPMPDVLPVEVAQLRHAVAAIEGGLASGRTVAVHCAAGIGRTGTVLSAFFVARGLSPDEAISTVKRLRPRSAVSTVNRLVLVEFAHEVATSRPREG